MDDPALFGADFTGESWKPWRVLLASLFALEGPTDHELFAVCTGRQEPQAEPCPAPEPTPEPTPEARVKSVGESAADPVGGVSKAVPTVAEESALAAPPDAPAKPEPPAPPAPPKRTEKVMQGAAEELARRLGLKTPPRRK